MFSGTAEVQYSRSQLDVKVKRATMLYIKHFVLLKTLFVQPGSFDQDLRQVQISKMLTKRKHKQSLSFKSDKAFLKLYHRKA